MKHNTWRRKTPNRDYVYGHRTGEVRRAIEERRLPFIERVALLDEKILVALLRKGLEYGYPCYQLKLEHGYVQLYTWGPSKNRNVGSATAEWIILDFKGDIRRYLYYSDKRASKLEPALNQVLIFTQLAKRGLIEV